MRRMIAAAGMLVLVSACTSGPGRPDIVRATTPAANPAPAFRAPGVMRVAGVEGIIGERAGSLTRRLGEARIDLVEGDARKLQFASDRCVLDVFLYPLEANGEPVATHVVARERKGGAQTDRAGCVRDIEQTAGRR